MLFSYILLTCRLSPHHDTHPQSEECCGLHLVPVHRCWCAHILSESLQPVASLPLAMWHSTSESACRAAGNNSVSTRSTDSHVRCPTEKHNLPRQAWIFNCAALSLMNTVAFVSVIVINVQAIYTHSYLIHNFSDLRFKSHVKHPVSFVKDKVSTPPEIGLSSF